MSTLLIALIFIAGCGGRPRPAVRPAARPSPAVARLRANLDRLLTAAPFEHTTWSVFIRSLAQDETLYTLNAAKLLIPASNMKIVTLAAASERLGWQFAFETQLAAAGPIESGTLNGDLIVVGSGDPSLDDWDGAASRLFTMWAAELEAHGITRIAGRIVGDDNRIDDQILGTGWAWDDLASSFAAPVGALQFNENTSRLTVTPGSNVGDPAIVSIAPGGSGLVVHGSVRTAAAGTVATIESRRGASSTVLELRGSVPIGAAPVVRNVSVSNPTLYFVSALREALIANGIEVTGPAIDIDDISDASPAPTTAPLISYSSPLLSSLSQTMMKNSQNLFAESLFNAAGSREGVRAVLQQWGIADSSIVVADGSGLSRYNLVTSEALVSILTHIYRDDRLREPFTASLPIAGRDGTLSNEMKGTNAEGNARAKTGSMSHVCALSGYVRTAAGEPLVFSIIANNYEVPNDVVDNAIDAAVIHLADFKR